MIPPTTDAMLRVNHAGERAAVHIYKGQLQVLGQSHIAPQLHDMLAQESTHHQAFEAALTHHQIAPTLFQPFWEKTAYALGVATALMGPKAAMACTEAVEEVITAHYQQQIEILEAHDPESSILPLIRQAHADEAHHHKVSQEYQQSHDFSRLKSAIRFASRLAIRLSETI